jgi:hypothetical protein
LLSTAPPLLAAEAHGATAICRGHDAGERRAAYAPPLHAPRLDAWRAH